MPRNTPPSAAPSNNGDDVDLLDIPATAAFFNTSERHVRHLVARREIPHLKVGALVRFRRSDLLAYLADRTVPAKAK